MLLRNSISNTRKFFQRTLGSLKSLFSSATYQKLPKSPDHLNNINPSFSYGTGTTSALDMNIQQWAGSGKAIKRRNKMEIMPTSTNGDQHKEDGDHHDDHDVRSWNNKLSVLNSSSAASSTSPLTKSKKNKRNEVMERRSDQAYPTKNKVVIMKRTEGFINSDQDRGIITRNYALVEKKLKELEMLDVSNVDHVLDIEEVLHYYSRLTCPAYRQIVDNFFMEIFAELFASNSTPVRSMNSRLRPISR